MDTLALTHIQERPAQLVIDRDPPCYQNAWELTHLLRLYHQRMPRRVLEIGTFYGGTLQYWLDAAWCPFVVSVDLPQAEAANPARWQGWAEAHGCQLALLTGDSQDASMWRAVTDLSPVYDWLFIDADHSYAGVATDWQVYAQLVPVGGVIVLHDINARPGYGVSQLWREVQARGYLTQEINAGVPELCGIGVVYV